MHARTAFCASTSVEACGVAIVASLLPHHCNHYYSLELGQFVKYTEKLARMKLTLSSVLALFLLATTRRAHGFLPAISKNRIADVSYNTLNMCICIDCARVTNCAAYHFVETKHEQPHMTENPTFEPRDGSPTIHVNVRTIRNNQDRKKEIERMWREHEGETQRAMENQDKDDDTLYGEETYDLTPVTTYEYDVVKCEDFVSDPGCWVRNMPEEIRLANPDFVPS